MVIGVLEIMFFVLACVVVFGVSFMCFQGEGIEKIIGVSLIVILLMFVVVFGMAYLDGTGFKIVIG